MKISMNINSWFVLSFIITLQLSCSTSSLKKTRVSQKEKCSFFLNQVERYWELDSLGNNGFRLLASEKIQKLECKFEGMFWSDLENILGVPDSEFNLESKKVKRYKLTNYGPHDLPGQKYLDIVLDKKLIVHKSRFWTVDG